MRLRFHTLFGFAFTAVGFLPACAGGQTGDLSGQNSHEGGSVSTVGGCEEHRRKLADFDEATGAGTAAQLLAYAEQSFDAPVSWKTSSEDDTWTTSPESGQGKLHLDVARGVSAYELTYAVQSSEQGGPSIALLCPPTALGVEATVSVRTDGGALKETFTTLLRSSVAGVATLNVPVDLQKLGGDLSVALANPEAKLKQVQLSASLTSVGTTGKLAGTVELRSGNVIMGSNALLAVWPASAACQALFDDGAGLTVAVDDDVLGATGSDSLASVATAAPVDISWLNHDATTLSLAIEAAGDGCFRVRDDLPAELGGGVGVTYPVTLAVKSADGRVDGTYPAQVVVVGSGAAREVTASTILQLAPADVAKSGFASVEVPSDSEGLILNIESRLAGGQRSGTLSFSSITNPPCVTQPSQPMPGGAMGSPGCVGSSRTQLETASWTE